MAETTHRSTTRAGWTDAEKITLLFAMVEAKAGFTFKGLTLPEGRTEKACTHVIAKMRETMRNGGELSTTTTKATAAPKNGAGTGGATGKGKRMVDEAEVEDDEEVKTEKKVVKKRAVKAPKVEVKEEMDADEEAA